jgi:hypothetical protein
MPAPQTRFRAGSQFVADNRIQSLFSQLNELYETASTVRSVSDNHTLRFTCVPNKESASRLMHWSWVI